MSTRLLPEITTNTAARCLEAEHTCCMHRHSSHAAKYVYHPPICQQTDQKSMIYPMSAVKFWGPKYRPAYIMVRIYEMAS